MNRGDIVSRFFHEKKSFVHDQIDTTFEIDYINDLTIVATIGELGFEKIIAVGEYFRNSIINIHISINGASYKKLDLEDRIKPVLFILADAVKQGRGIDGNLVANKNLKEGYKKVDEAKYKIVTH